MATGIGVVPNGIGTGEAQVISLPGYQKAMYAKQKERQDSLKEQKLKEVEALAKMDINGVHQKDVPKIMSKYKSIQDTYQKYSTARTMEDRATLKKEMENLKRDFEFNVQNSKQYAKDLYDIGQTIVGSEEGKFDREQLDYYNRLKNSESNIEPIDRTKFQYKAKPADIIALKKKIRDNSIASTPPSVYQGKVGTQDVIVTDKGETLYRPTFTENVELVMEAEPSYAASLEKKYIDSFKKSGGDINNPEDFLKFITNAEFEAERPLADKSSKTVSQINNNNNYFSYGGGNAVKIDGLNTTKESDDIYTVEEVTGTVKGQNKGQVLRSQTISSPNIVDVRINPADIDITPKEYFDENGKLVKGNTDAFKGATLTGFVVKPIYNSNGEVKLWNERTTITNSDGKVTEVTNTAKPTGYVKFAKVLRKGEDKSTLVQLRDISLNTLNTRAVQQGAEKFFSYDADDSLPITTGKKTQAPAKKAGAKPKGDADKYGLN